MMSVQIDVTTNMVYIILQRKLQMRRTFIEVPIFTRKWYELGLTDEDLRQLQNILLDNPKQGVLIQGTGGLRKIRVGLESHGTGKRGGARVIYVDAEVKETIYFINVYSKREQTDLTPDEKRTLKEIVKILKEE